MRMRMRVRMRLFSQTFPFVRWFVITSERSVAVEYAVRVHAVGAALPCRVVVAPPPSQCPTWYLRARVVDVSAVKNLA